MAAGSVIAAMAGEQNLDRMGGFRARHAVHVRLHGGRRPRALGHPALLGLLLQGRDPRPSWPRARAGTSSLAVVGYLGAFLTAVYTWRMIFRAFYGDPVDAGQASSSTATSTTRRSHEPGHRRGRGHRRRLPRPRAPHRRARVVDEGRHGPAGGARHHRRRRCRSPKVTERPAPLPRADLPRLPLLRGAGAVQRTPSSGLAGGALLGIAGIALAYRLWVQQPERPAAIRARLAGLHSFFVQQVVLRRAHRPADRAAVGLVRPLRAQRVRARRRQAGCSSAGTSGAVRAGSAAVRAAQSGFLRYYAALLRSASPALGLYFLISAS